MHCWLLACLLACGRALLGPCPANGDQAGDATVHHERLLHGSGETRPADSWRRAWVVAFRSDATVAEERRRGFTHSHNDDLQVLNQVGKE